MTTYLITLILLSADPWGLTMNRQVVRERLAFNEVIFSFIFTFLAREKIFQLK